MLGGIASAKRRTATRLKDWVKFSPITREVRALSSWARYRFHPRRVDKLIETYQKTELAFLRRAAVHRLSACIVDPRINFNDLARKRWARFLGDPALTRSIILKAPGACGEKGVLLLTAEYNWVKLLTTRGDLASLDTNYTILFSAGWSPLDYSLIGQTLQKTRSPMYIEPGNFEEVPRIEALSARVKCLPTICSAWIHPGLFKPKPHGDRRIDLLMVANWAPFKRHWHFFSALKRMPRELRISLIGQPDGPFQIDRIRRQAKDFGVIQDIKYLENLRVEEVYDAMCDSRAVVILSRQEGPCVVVTESMFADTAVVLLRDAHIGSRAYINEQTGILVGHKRMDRQLMDLLRREVPLNPRKWANENISCQASLARWNSFLREESRAQGLPWTRDLVPFCWKPYTLYLNHQDRLEMQDAFAELRRQHPEIFGPEFLPSSLPSAVD